MAANRTVSIYPSGSTDPPGDDASYTIMALMEAGEDGDITGVGGWLQVDVVTSDGSWAAADGPVTFAGWTCDYASGEYINIDVKAGARNTYTDGKYSTSYYRIESAIDTNCFYLDNNTSISIVIEGIQLKASGAYSTRCISMSNDSGPGTVKVLQSFLWNIATGADSYTFMDAYTTTHNVDLINCIFIKTGGNADNTRFLDSDSTINIYNCTIHGGPRDAVVDAGTGTNKLVNCAIFDSTDDISGTWNTISHCATDDDHSGDDANWVDISPVNGDEDSKHDLAFTDHDNNDYRVKDTNSVLYRAGLDHSTDALVPTVDIAGNARVDGQESIGAFEYVVGVVILATQDSWHNHLADNVATTRIRAAMTRNGIHNQIANVPSLPGVFRLRAKSSIHDHKMDTVEETRVRGIATQHSLHDHLASIVPRMAMRRGITVQEALHDQLSNVVSQTRVRGISVQDSLHDQLADVVAEIRIRGLTVQYSLHDQLADSIQSPRIRVLDVQKSLHNQLADSIALTRLVQLIAQGALHGQFANVSEIIGEIYPLYTFLANNEAYHFLANNEAYHFLANNEAYHFLTKKEK